MKKWFLIILSIVFIDGCSKKEKLDIKISQVINDIKWDDNYSNTRNTLEYKYGLKYNKEIEQNTNDNKVYEFEGGKISGIDSYSWSLSLNKDSLYFLLIKIESKNVEDNSKNYEKLINEIKSLPMEKILTKNNGWIISDKKKVLCGLQVSRDDKGIVVLFSSTKFINQFTYK